MRGQVDSPLVIDLTELPVLEAALALYGGKAVLNSINFEDGEAPATARMTLARKFGAAVIALTIDEAGMAKSRDKVGSPAAWSSSPAAASACRCPTCCSTRSPSRSAPATRTTASSPCGPGGDRGHPPRIPELQLILGLSNVSFGLNPAARHVLNSVMLDHAMRRGLTGAIVHPARSCRCTRSCPRRSRPPRT